jgi:tRNA G10  N-methylase Trm11
MLRKARALLREGGFVAVVLPLATVDNSRYFNDETLRAQMTSLQLAERVVHRSLKLYFALVGERCCESDASVISLATVSTRQRDRH